jgi:hypothetical protein
MNIVAKIKNASLYPLAYSIVSAQSLVSRVKALGKKPVVHFEQPYAGQKILLLALYEKGRLRADIENLLTTAKSLGMYVLAVNTLKVLDPDSLKDKIDCYIERPNFGRDFGSYQTGFLHFYKKGWGQQCERLLMLNDSLFYSKANLKSFLEQMITSEIEVLGATENHEVEHHLGSFCISIDQHILQQTRFKRYWANYANTDVRPKVIKRGEMKLSKTLRRCVSSPDMYSALFDMSYVADSLNNHKVLINVLPQLYRTSKILDILWKRSSLKSAAGRFMDRYLFIGPGLANIEANIEAKTIYFVDDAFGLINAIETSAKDSNLKSLKERVLKEVKNDFLECFTSGSQIHQNNILLHHLGMPIIKLDGLYRGMFSVEDVQTLANQLGIDEKNHFMHLMYSKSFGGNTLFGWKRAAFYRGLI